MQILKSLAVGFGMVTHFTGFGALLIYSSSNPYIGLPMLFLYLGFTLSAVYYADKRGWL